MKILVHNSGMLETLYVTQINFWHRVSMLSGGQRTILSLSAVSLCLPGILSEFEVWHTASFQGGSSSLSWVQTSCQEISPTHLHCSPTSLGLGACAASALGSIGIYPGTIPSSWGSMNTKPFISRGVLSPHRGYVDKWVPNSIPRTPPSLSALDFCHSV